MIGPATLLREPQSARQVAIADQLVLTKTDLLEADAAHVLAEMRRLNPHAPILVASRGRIDATALLLSQKAGPAELSPELTAWLADERRPERAPLHEADIAAIVVRRIGRYRQSY